MYKVLGTAPGTGWLTSQFFSLVSSSHLRDEKANLYPYGRIKTVFDIMELAEYPIETYLYGNAVKMN